MSVRRVGPNRTPIHSSSLRSGSRTAYVSSTVTQSGRFSTKSRFYVRVDRVLFFLAEYYMTRVRCTASTRKGAQCLRNARESHTTCSLHAVQSPQCPVCLGDMSVQTTRTLECGHAFHTRCLERWKRTSRTCPMCRTPFDQPQYKVRVSVQRLVDSHVSSETYTTSNVDGLISSFGIDPFMDARFITDIIFDIADGESIASVLNDLGVRIPSQPFGPVPTRPAPPHT